MRSAPFGLLPPWIWDSLQWRFDAAAGYTHDHPTGMLASGALAIAIYAAPAHPGPEEMIDALALAVTHSGDSDSTGAICGNILDALHGETALPPELAFELEGRDPILTLADDFIYEFTAGDRLHGDYGPYTRWTDRYPGW